MNEVYVKFNSNDPTYVGPMREDVAYGVLFGLTHTYLAHNVYTDAEIIDNVLGIPKKNIVALPDMRPQGSNKNYIQQGAKALLG